jgi:AraC-like DNA-binding protein
VILQILAAIGLIQGLVLATALFRARNRNPVGFAALLTALVAAMAIVVEDWFVQTGAWREFPHVLRATTWMPYLIGPGVWLFARSLERPFELRWSALHFLPAALALAYFLPFYARSGAEKIAFVSATHTIPLETSLLGLTKAIALLGYLTATLWVLWRLPRSTLARSAFWSVLGFLVFVLLVAAGFATEHVVDRLPMSSDLLAATGLAVFLYSLSLVVLINWRAFAINPTGGDPARPSRDGNGLLDAETTERLFSEISAVVATARLHEEPQLTVSRLAERTGFQPHYLSYVINAQTGLNVKAWLNTLRVEDAKQRLISEPDETILSIALACGFNSKAAFNRSFKAVTGQSPSGFRASHFAK